MKCEPYVVPEQRGHAEEEHDGHEEDKQDVVLGRADILRLDPEPDEVAPRTQGYEDAVEQSVTQKQHEKLK